VIDAVNNVKFTIMDNGPGMLLNYNPVLGKDPVNGIATVVYKSTQTTTGTFNIMVQLSGTSINQPVNLNAIAGPIARVICSADATRMVADGVTAVTITAGIADAFGNPVDSASNIITFGLSGQGNISGANPATPVNGVASVSLISTLTAGTITMSATATGLTQGTTAVTAVAGNISLTVNTTTFFATDEKTFNVTIKDGAGTKIDRASTPLEFKTYLLPGNELDSYSVRQENAQSGSCSFNNMLFAKTGIFSVKVTGPGMGAASLEVKSYIDKTQSTLIMNVSSDLSSEVNVRFPSGALNVNDAMIEIKEKDKIDDAALLTKIQQADEKAAQFPEFIDQYSEFNDDLIRVDAILRPVRGAQNSVRSINLHDSAGNEITAGPEQNYEIHINYYKYRLLNDTSNIAWRTIYGDVVAEKHLRVCVLDEDNAVWVPLPQRLDRIGENAWYEYIKTQVKHFSVYCLMSAVEENTEKLALWNVLNYPNPFARKTSFAFMVNKNSDVTIEIYTVNGRVIDKITTTGTQAYNSVEWDGSACANGIYFYKLTVKSGEETLSTVNKLVIMR
jgi:hypothetical protein